MTVDYDKKELYGYSKSKGYEVINSRYAQVWMTEEKIKLFLELNAIQGGVYMDGKKVALCEGVQVYEDEQAKTK